MTDHEDNAHPADCCCPRCGDPVTQKELVAESERVIAVVMKRQVKLAETIRDQISYLSKTQTVALMAGRYYATMPATTMPDAASCAEKLYREVQKTLETTSISA